MRKHDARGSDVPRPKLAQIIQITKNSPMKTETRYLVQIKDVEFACHDVRRFVLEKPAGYKFRPGQATNFSLPGGDEGDESPFSFTSLNSDDELEFHIKLYPERDGFTEKLMGLNILDELVIGKPWGAIEYQGAGTFLAGGAGVTPFISILRQLERDGSLADNDLYFSSRDERDVFLRPEFERMFGGDDVHFCLTGSGATPAWARPSRIDKRLLQLEIDRRDRDRFYYVCGPPEMVEDLVAALTELGIHDDRIVTEDGFG